LDGLDSLHATTFLLFADFPLSIFSFNFFKIKNRVAPYFLFFVVPKARLLLFLCWASPVEIVLTAERLLIVRRPRVVILEEGNGELSLIVRVARRECAHVQVAGLNHSAIHFVVPRRVLTEQNAKLPKLEPLLRLNEGESSNQFQLVYRYKQVRALTGIQNHGSALFA
jgi:hypothetical protein